VKKDWDIAFALFGDEIPFLKNVLYSFLKSCSISCLRDANF